MGKELGAVKVRSEVVKTSVASVWLGKDGILRVILRPGIVLGLDGVKENEAARYKILEYRKIPILVDMREIKAMTKEAREYAASNEHTGSVSAMALLENSAVGKFIVNLFINLSKPSFPTKMFNSEVAAVEWLKGFLD